MIGEYFKYTKIDNKCKNPNLKIRIEGIKQKKKDMKQIKLVCNTLTKDRS